MRNNMVNTMSISIDFVRTAISRVQLSEYEIDTLLYSCKIPRVLLDEPIARVSLSQYARFITALMNLSNDEMLGHAPTVVPLGSLSVLCHWLVAAENVGQALHRLSRFYQMFGLGAEVTVWTKDELIYVELGIANYSRESCLFVAEFSFFCFHRILSWLKKEIIPIKQLCFPYDMPLYAKDYRLMFYGAPILFARNRATMAFCRSVLEEQIVQNSKNLKNLLSDPFTELLMLNFHDGNWYSIVSNAIRNQLHNLPTLPALAAELDIAPHTLQRRLAGEDLTYLAIKNQMKRDAAIEMLVHTSLSIDEISARLGFSEASPFSRTFKDWTGVPPSAYRKRNNLG